MAVLKALTGWKRGGAAALAMGLAATIGSPAFGQPSALETAVKATYLYKLAPFVTWPSGALAEGAPFAICVVGSDPFGAVLDRAVAGQAVGSHPIVVRRLGRADPAAACPMMYLGGSRAQPVKDALQALKGLPVLTVTDGPGAAGVVDFAVVDGRVRLRIDDRAAAEGGLVISSKLLSLALSVRPRGAGANP